MSSVGPSSSSKGAKSKSSNAFLATVVSYQQQLSASADLNPLQSLLEVTAKHAKQVHTLLQISFNAKGKRIQPDENDQKVAQLLKAIHVATHVLQRSFTSLLQQDRIRLTGETNHFGFLGNVAGNQFGKKQNQVDSPRQVVERWLQGRWNGYILLLTVLLGMGNSSSFLAEALEELRRQVLQSLLVLQLESSQSLARQMTKDDDSATPVWSSSPWRALVVSLVANPVAVTEIKLDTDENIRSSFENIGSASSTPVEQDVRQMFADEVLEKYDDGRYAALRELSALAGVSYLRSNALQLLVLLTSIPAQQSDLNTFFLPDIARFAPSRSKVRAGSKRKGLEGESDDEEEAEEDAPIEDWFSDSDEEASAETKSKKRKANSSAAALGSSAVRAEKLSKGRRRRGAALPFYQAVHSVPQQKAVFSSAWLSLLLPPSRADGSGPAGGALSLAHTHEILLRLHIQILPHLLKPTMLLDWLVDSVDAGGATSLLALNGLFTLMIKHNLDYPAFYPKLYALLGGSTRDAATGKTTTTPSVLHMRYRSRFLRLLDTFLSSTHLPATLVASFAKRLSRLSLRAPPAAVVSVLPLIWTMLKRNPQCMQLIHRNFTSDASTTSGAVDKFSSGPSGVTDPYDPIEADPTKTRAIESSLWELASLGASLAAAQNNGRDPIGIDGLGGQSHWLHSVTTLSRILADPFTRERYDLDDFLDLTYATLFDTETAPTIKPNEKRKRTPPVPALNDALPQPQFHDMKTHRAFLTWSAVDREAESSKAAEADEAHPRREPKKDIMDIWVF